MSASQLNYGDELKKYINNYFYALKNQYIPTYELHLKYKNQIIESMKNDYKTVMAGGGGTGIKMSRFQITMNKLINDYEKESETLKEARDFINQIDNNYEQVDKINDLMTKTAKQLKDGNLTKLDYNVSFKKKNIIKSIEIDLGRVEKLTVGVPKAGQEYAELRDKYDGMKTMYKNLNAMYDQIYSKGDSNFDFIGAKIETIPSIQIKILEMATDPTVKEIAQKYNYNTITEMDINKMMHPFSNYINKPYLQLLSKLPGSMEYNTTMFDNLTNAKLSSINGGFKHRGGNDLTLEEIIELQKVLDECKREVEKYYLNENGILKHIQFLIAHATNIMSPGKGSILVNYVSRNNINNYKSVIHTLFTKHNYIPLYSSFRTSIIKTQSFLLFIEKVLEYFEKNAVDTHFEEGKKLCQYMFVSLIDMMTYPDLLEGVMLYNYVTPLLDQYAAELMPIVMVSVRINNIPYIKGNEIIDLKKYYKDRGISPEDSNKFNVYFDKNTIKTIYKDKYNKIIAEEEAKGKSVLFIRSANCETYLNSQKNVVNNHDHEAKHDDFAPQSAAAASVSAAALAALAPKEGEAPVGVEDANGITWFTFDRVYGESYASIDDIVTKELYGVLLKSGHGMMFLSRGYSGSGKTYLLFGKGAEVKGIIQAAISKVQQDIDYITVRVYEFYGLGIPYSYYWKDAEGNVAIDKLAMWLIQSKIDNNMTFQNFEVFDAADIARFINNEIPGQNTHIRIDKDKFDNLENLINTITDHRIRGSGGYSKKKDSSYIDEFNKRIKKTTNNEESSRSVMIYEFGFKFAEREELVPFIIADLPGKEKIFESFVKDKMTNVANFIKNGQVSPLLQHELAFGGAIMSPMDAVTFRGDNIYDTYCKFVEDAAKKIPNADVNSFGEYHNVYKTKFTHYTTFPGLSFDKPIKDNDYFRSSTKNSATNFEFFTNDTIKRFELFKKTGEDSEDIVFNKKNMAAAIIYDLIQNKRIKELYLLFKAVFEDNAGDILLAYEGYFIDENVVSLLKIITERNKKNDSNIDQILQHNFQTQEETDVLKKFINVRTYAYASDLLSDDSLQMVKCQGAEPVVNPTRDRGLKQIVGLTLNLLSKNEWLDDEKQNKTVNEVFDSYGFDLNSIKEISVFKQNRKTFTPTVANMTYYYNSYSKLHDADKLYTYKHCLMEEIMSASFKNKSLKKYVMFTVVSNNPKQDVHSNKPNGKCHPQADYIKIESGISRVLVDV
jgi:hypothetical protein